MTIVVHGIRPIPGFEFECDLAWKHRSIAFEWVRRIGRNPFAFKAYRRAFRLWGNAVDRTKRYTETYAYIQNDEGEGK